jgi:hypothetical protein
MSSVAMLHPTGNRLESAMRIKILLAVENQTFATAVSNYLGLLPSNKEMSVQNAY